MEDSIVIQSTISREDFDGIISLLRLVGKRKFKASDKEEIECLWNAMKQAPCDLSEIPEEDFDDDITREQVQFMMLTLALHIGIARMEKGGEK